MRPIDKGPIPLDANGTLKTVSNYKNWRRDLIKRIGKYCVYCNIPISPSLQVEHVQPIKPADRSLAGEELSWDNLLLACGCCNNAKSNKFPDQEIYYLPHLNNTLMPFKVKIIQDSVGKHAIISVKEGLTEVQKEKAQKTIDLFKLSNIDNRDGVVDLRSEDRYEALLNVEFYKELIKVDFREGDFEKKVKLILVQMSKSGFFALWFEAFSDEPEILEALIKSSEIPGTALNCFDESDGFNFLGRNPNNQNDTI